MRFCDHTKNNTNKIINHQRKSRDKRRIKQRVNNKPPASTFLNKLCISIVFKSIIEILNFIYLFFLFISKIDNDIDEEFDEESSEDTEEFNNLLIQQCQEPVDNR